MKDKVCVVCETHLSGQKQKYCSNACKQKHHYHRVKFQPNTYHSQTLRALRRKLKLVEIMGGKCCKCGYQGNLSALQFHHLNPTKKHFKLDARVLSNKNWESIQREAKKCILLCANCHFEEHNPELSIQNVLRITNGAPIGKPVGAKGVNSGKP
ncbi:MAG: hypothetical protein H6563_03390 [Lewinellaceae bacterium]|nr:hypothetical protein [Lewinellaceae bacterium]